jgi:hypothetical protein
MGRGSLSQSAGATVALRRSSEVRLWLDDERDPRVFAPDQEWVWVKTVAEAQALLLSGGVVAMSLDHDLGDADQPSGYDLCLWLAERGFSDPSASLWPPKVSVHSQNGIGAERMCGVIERYGHYHRLGRSFQETSP